MNANLDLKRVLVAGSFARNVNFASGRGINLKLLYLSTGAGINGFDCDQYRDWIGHNKSESGKYNRSKATINENGNYLDEPVAQIYM